MKRHSLLGIYSLTYIITMHLPAVAQHMDAEQIRKTLEVATLTNDQPTEGQSPQPWWDPTISSSIGLAPTPIAIDINQLVELALMHSAQIKVYSEVPLIRETAIREATAAFDWIHFGETLWNDSSDPVGSSLTVGGSGTRYQNHQWTAAAGYKRRATSGGEFDIRQNLGWQDTNSNFFVPNNQGTAKLSLGFTQPLMKGSGQAYNRSLIVLADIDTNCSKQEFKRQLQTHLMEVIRGYWALYLERAALVQKVGLYNRTNAIYEQLRARSSIDAGEAQLSSASAALEARRSDLVRARASVENSETRLRALTNAVELEGDIELIPMQFPSLDYFPTTTMDEIETAVQNRPEIVVAMQEIKSGCVRLNMAKNEMMPMLNLVTRAYVAGLQGDSQVLDAWASQFNTGAPSYSAGLQYEIPVGRRAAKANLSRRQIEVRQLQEQYRTALENIKAEVEVAVREMETSYREMHARYRSMLSAVKESETLEARWKLAADPGSGSLNLQALLRAQERLTETEYEFSKALLTYNLSLMNLKQVNGTMLAAENIDIARVASNSGPTQVPIEP